MSEADPLAYWIDAGRLSLIHWPARRFASGKALTRLEMES